MNLRPSRHEWMKLRAVSAAIMVVATAATQEHAHCRPHPLGGGLDVRIPDMRVPHRHGRVAVAEQARDDRDRHPPQNGLARERVPAVVEPHVLKSGAPPDEGPDTERAGTRPGGVQG